VYFVGLFLSSLLKMHGPKKQNWFKIFSELRSYYGVKPIFGFLLFHVQ